MNGFSLLDWLLLITAAISLVMFFIVIRKWTFVPIWYDSLQTIQGRKASAFLAALGAAIVMTLYSATALIIVRDHHADVLWLGMAAHAQILIMLTGLMALLVERRLKVSRDGIDIQDQGADGDPIASGDSVKIVKEPE